MQKYTIASKALGHTGINELAQEMAAESTVTRHDVKAVLSSLEDHIMRNLRQGHTVQLGDLGSFHLTLSSAMVEEEKDVNPSLVKGVNVRFVPSKAFKNALKLGSEFVSFKPYYPEAAAETEETPAETPETPEKGGEDAA